MTSRADARKGMVRSNQERWLAAGRRFTVGYSHFQSMRDGVLGPVGRVTVRRAVKSATGASPVSGTVGVRNACALDTAARTICVQKHSDEHPRSPRGLATVLRIKLAVWPPFVGESWFLN